MKIAFLYSGVGRGHAHYLDGIVESLEPERIGQVLSVFDVTRGSCLAAWRLARALYSLAPLTALGAALYGFARGRTSHESPGLLQRLMARDVRGRFPEGEGLLVVDHPLLAGFLAGRRGLVYQHGEAAVPPESIVPGVRSVMVPDADAAAAMLRGGVAAGALEVTGLCIEPALVRQVASCHAARAARLAVAERIPCGAFFSSGAEPPAHVEKLVRAAVSLARQGGDALLFAAENGRFARCAREAFRRHGVPLRGSSSGADSATGAQLVLHGDRHALNRQTAEAFPRMDFFMAPSHERTAWALGLGLPMAIADPPLGSFSPLNRDILLKAGVAFAVASCREADRIGPRLCELVSTGTLTSMCRSGYGSRDIGGFARCAALLLARSESTGRIDP